MPKTATTRIFLDTYHPKADQKCAIKLEVYYDRKRRHYPTDHNLTEQEYQDLKREFDEKKKKIRKTKEQNELNEDLVFFEAKAKEIIKELRDKFSFPVFTKMFEKQRASSNCAFKLLDDKIVLKKNEGKIQSAVMIGCAVKSFRDFYTKNTLPFELIDVDLLNRYEKWMREKGNSGATIGMYVRQLRTLFNEEIDAGMIPKEVYPFKGKRCYKIPTGKNIKKALNKIDLEKIDLYEPKTETERKARDFWFFSYLCNGMNVKDIALLKFKNITGEWISFERAKTKDVNKEDPIKIEFQITVDVQRIIKTWGNKVHYPSNYIFPILDTKDTPEQEYHKIQRFVKFINKYMKRIAKGLEINANLTTYVARHSFVNAVVRTKGIEAAKDSVGHSNSKTTQNYVGSLDEESKREIAASLTDWRVIKDKKLLVQNSNT